jgi:hypothetical protein
MSYRYCLAVALAAAPFALALQSSQIAANSASHTKIEGAVLGTSAQPVAGATVTFQISGKRAKSSVTTDDEGRFLIDGVRDKTTYRMTASFDGKSSDTSMVTPDSSAPKPVLLIIETPGHQPGMPLSPAIRAIRAPAR